MKKLVTTLGLVVVSVLVAGSASAATINFDLNCTFNPPGGCDPSVSFGTLSLSDTATAGEFDLSVDLVGNGVHNIQSIFLNFAPGLTDFTITDANGDGVDQVENGIQADGFTLGLFDLEIPSSGNLGFEPYSNTLIVSGVGFEALTVDAFNDVISGNGLLHVAVHIGAIGEVDGGPYIPGVPGEGSVFVSNAADGPPPTATPEPGLLVLLGTGLLGVAAATRRRTKV